MKGTTPMFSVGHQTNGRKREARITHRPGEKSGRIRCRGRFPSVTKPAMTKVTKREIETSDDDGSGIIVRGIKAMLDENKRMLCAEIRFLSAPKRKIFKKNQ